MNKEKIAIMMDSGCDLPKEMIEKYGIIVVPLRLIYKDNEYEDKVDITNQEVYDRLETEIPTTSLPSYDTVNNAFTKMKEKGFTHVFAVSISASMSGTNNLFRILKEEHEDLTIEVVDTKNLSIGSGLTALKIAEMAEANYSFEKICSKISDIVENTKIIFTLPTLKYVIAGGRIGNVSGFIGELLNIKPIMTCNEEGIFDTVGTARGFKNAEKKVYELVRKYAEKLGRFRAFYAYTTLDSEVIFKIKEFEEKFKDAKMFGSVQTGPTIGVHAGPGLMGVGIQKMD